jgi:hypothetical protein
MKPIVLVLSGIAIGACFGAAFTSRVSAETRPAEPPPAVRWENVCEAAPSLQDANRAGARRGDAGWELVSLANGVACFKKPVAPPAPAPDKSWPGY